MDSPALSTLGAGSFCLLARGAETPAAQSTVLVRPVPPVANFIATASSTISVTTPRMNGDAQVLERLGGFLGQDRREARQHAIGHFEQEHFGFAGVDVAKVPAQRMFGQFAKCAGELHARGAAADDDKCHPGFAFLGVLFAFCRFKRQENSPADLGGILDSFEAGGVGFPLMVAEVKVARSAATTR